MSWKVELGPLAAEHASLGCDDGTIKDIANGRGWVSANKGRNNTTMTLHTHINKNGRLEKEDASKSKKSKETNVDKEQLDLGIICLMLF
ncbi:MAG: hypothetical protein ACM3UZ_03640 [Acidobacteriota bacterium]